MGEMGFDPSQLIPLAAETHGAIHMSALHRRAV